MPKQMPYPSPYDRTAILPETYWDIIATRGDKSSGVELIIKGWASKTAHDNKDPEIGQKTYLIQGLNYVHYYRAALNASPSDTLEQLADIVAWQIAIDHGDFVNAIDV